MNRTLVCLLLISSFLPALPRSAWCEEPVGVVDAARESLFGDVYAQPSTWQALPLGSLFSEGWNQPWASPPPGPGGAPRQGWINAYDGVFYRLGIVTFGYARRRGEREPVHERPHALHTLQPALRDPDGRAVRGLERARAERESPHRIR